MFSILANPAFLGPPVCKDHHQLYDKKSPLFLSLFHCLDWIVFFLSPISQLFSKHRKKKKEIKKTNKHSSPDPRLKIEKQKAKDSATSHNIFAAFRELGITINLYL